MQYTAVIEHCVDTDLYVGYIPGFPGAHSQGSTLDELRQNMQEVTENNIAIQMQEQQLFHSIKEGTFRLFYCDKLRRI